MSDTKRLCNKSEAARHFGVSRALITRKCQQGKLVMVGDLIDVDASTCAFGGNGKPIVDNPSLEVAKEPDELETLASAQRRKETALANLREAEHLEKIGRLVDLAETERAWATTGQTLRDGFLALPEQIAPQLAALTDKMQVRDLLRAEIRKILGNLPGQIKSVPNQQAA